MTGKERIPVRVRYEAMVDRSGGPDACHPWTGGTRGGYGRVRNEPGGVPIKVPVHRLTYEVFVGPIPDGFVVDHACHNEAAKRGECEGGDACSHRLCCNPRHLVAVSAGGNIANSPLAITTQNAQKTRCPHGHQYTAENTFVNANGRRECRACRTNRSRVRRAKR